MILCAMGRNVMSYISLSLDEEESVCAYFVHDATVPSSRKPGIWPVSSASKSSTPKIPTSQKNPEIHQIGSSRTGKSPPFSLEMSQAEQWQVKPKA